MPADIPGADWEASLAALGDTPGAQVVEQPLGPGDGPVCVTGATGFLALHVVEQLLMKGYDVVATVRSLSNQQKMAPLFEFRRRFPGEGRLRFVPGVDLLDAGSFGDAVRDCVGVFHTASPFTVASTDPLSDLVPPAIQGTTACLDACAFSGTVRRVVVTSSIAAIANNGAYPWDYTYSERDWNVTSKPDMRGRFEEPVGFNGYRYSKTVAEKAAWAEANKYGCPFDLATVNPPLIMGRNHNVPASAADLNQSTAIMHGVLTGKRPPGLHSSPWVDVADAARAHIAVYETPAAGGKRFLCACEEVPTWTGLARMVKELYPELPVDVTPPAAGEGLRVGVDCSRLRTVCGFRFTPLRDTVRAQCNSLIEQGFVPGGILAADPEAGCGCAVL